MQLRCTSSTINSERRRIRVIGVLKSWLMAASILVRSSIRVEIRSRIPLSALATERISSGPRSGSGAAAPFRLKLSAALANDDSGAVKARAVHRPSNVTLMAANSNVVLQEPCGNHRAVRQRDTGLGGVLLMRQRKDSVIAAKAAMQAAQLGVSRFVRRRDRSRRKASDVQLRKCPRDVGEKLGPLGRGRRPEKLEQRNPLTVFAVD